MNSEFFDNNWHSVLVTFNPLLVCMWHGDYHTCRLRVHWMNLWSNIANYIDSILITWYGFYCIFYLKQRVHISDYGYGCLLIIVTEEKINGWSRGWYGLLSKMVFHTDTSWYMLCMIMHSYVCMHSSYLCSIPNVCIWLS